MRVQALNVILATKTQETYSVDHKTDGEHFNTLLSQLSTIFLHETYNQGSQVLVVVIISVFNVDMVLRIRPEGIYT